MCAGGESKDACQGFGGAPLVFRENGLFKQVYTNGSVFERKKRLIFFLNSRLA